MSKAVNDALLNLIRSDPDVSLAQPVVAAYLISHHASAVITAAELVDLCISQTSEDATESIAGAIGGFLWMTAIDIPALAGRIAALAAEINSISQQSPAASSEQPASAKRKAAARGFWKQFHESTGEYLQSKYYDARQPSNGDDSALAEYFGLNLFIAAFVAHSSRLETRAETPYYDLGDAWMALSGLEDKFDDKACADASADADVPASAAWILEAGPVMYDACKGNKGIAGNDVRGPLWKGPGDFNIERWNFWKTRFSLAVDLDFASPKTKLVARSALAHMHVLERA